MQFAKANGRTFASLRCAKAEQRNTQTSKLFLRAFVGEYDRAERILQTGPARYLQQRSGGADAQSRRPHLQQFSPSATGKKRLQ